MNTKDLISFGVASLLIYVASRSYLVWIATTLLLGIFTLTYIYVERLITFFFPIINSLLDTDVYKFYMQQVVFHRFPDAIAEYTFINRGNTAFPEGFAEALQKEVNAMAKLRLSKKERSYLANICDSGEHTFKTDYLIWLANYRFKPEQVKIEQDGGTLNIKIKGLWVETILWEVPLMALISELYFRMKGAVPYKDYCLKIKEKALIFTENNVRWVEFGTRRRFSKKVQDQANYQMKDAYGFKGTSNPYFAMKYNIPVVGTYAHEAVMAMGARYGAKDANIEWLRVWIEEYPKNLKVCLPDTYTTDVFLRNFPIEFAKRYTLRQDSGDPEVFADKLLEFYKENNIDAPKVGMIFSDSLDVNKAIALAKKYFKIYPVMGIGTNITNDCGHKPLNMVIKLSAINFGDMIPVVKLSDDKGKHTGNPDAVQRVKQELGI